MGITNAILKVKEQHKSGKTAEVSFLVDGGAVYSLVPGMILDELGIEPYPTMTLHPMRMLMAGLNK